MFSVIFWIWSRFWIFSCGAEQSSVCSSRLERKKVFFRLEYHPLTVTRNFFVVVVVMFPCVHKSIYQCLTYCISYCWTILQSLFYWLPVLHAYQAWQYFSLAFIQLCPNFHKAHNSKNTTRIEIIESKVLSWKHKIALFT